MNLLELLDRHRGLFYRQSWYLAEAFMRYLPVDVPIFPPTQLVETGTVPPAGQKLYRAVDLATCYLQHPSAPIWRDYLWTSDHDARGQRVYVGGVGNGHGFELHRHLHLTDRFGCPAWQ